MSRPVAADARQARARQGREPAARRRAGDRTREDIDLAKAYAIRAQSEKDERIAAERRSRKKRACAAKRAPSSPSWSRTRRSTIADAEIARHFPYGGKIKRIYVTADQLKALNAGELGVVQLDGRYLLVTRRAAGAGRSDLRRRRSRSRSIPNAPAGDDPYADPQYQVPDDLVW